jgi:hypothetical protein
MPAPASCAVQGCLQVRQQKKSKQQSNKGQGCNCSTSFLRCAGVPTAHAAEEVKQQSNKGHLQPQHQLRALRRGTYSEGSRRSHTAVKQGTLATAAPASCAAQGCLQRSQQKKSNRCQTRDGCNRSYSLLMPTALHAHMTWHWLDATCCIMLLPRSDQISTHAQH